MRKLIFIGWVSLLLAGCNASNPEVEQTQLGLKLSVEAESDTGQVFSLPSSQTNQAIGFHTPMAINRISAIENEYFNEYKTGVSRYYGTIWGQGAQTKQRDSGSVFDQYLNALHLRQQSPDSMHCTIYAMEALEAGFGTDFAQFVRHHQAIWQDREYAGWSVAYILTKHYGWTAYLVLDRNSSEYDQCLRNFAKDQKYHVWRQPDIPIKRLFHFEDEQAEIDSLLSLHEFGWGFSEQGWHTWITHFKTLKECNWAGAPSIRYGSEWEKPLFLSTPFTQYFDYASHILVFPPQVHSAGDLKK